VVPRDDDHSPKKTGTQEGISHQLEIQVKLSRIASAWFTQARPLSLDFFLSYGSFQLSIRLFPFLFPLFQRRNRSPGGGFL
jgi:hypothetical protein